MSRKETHLSFCLIIICLFVLAQPTVAQAENKIMTYTQLRKIVKSGQASQIQKVILTNGESRIWLQMTGGDQWYSVVVPQETRETLIQALDQADVDIAVHDPEPDKFWWSVATSFFLPFLLLIGFLFMFRSASRSNRLYQGPGGQRLTLSEMLRKKRDESRDEPGTWGK